MLLNSNHDRANDRQKSGSVSWTARWVGLCAMLLTASCSATGPRSNSTILDSTVQPRVLQGGSPPPRWVALAIPSPGFTPSHIAKGPDGNFWITGDPDSIAKVTEDGAFTIYPIPANDPVPEGITAGTDGNLWFTACNTRGIWKVTTSGVFTEYPLNISINCSAGDIVRGPGGALWFLSRSPLGVGRISTSGVFRFIPLSPPEFVEPWGIAAAGDGQGSAQNLWVTDVATQLISQITPQGVVAQFGPTTYPPREIIPNACCVQNGHDFWFVEESGSDDGTPGTRGFGPCTNMKSCEFTIGPGASPLGIALGWAQTDVDVTDARGILWSCQYYNGPPECSEHVMPPIFGGAPSTSVTMGPDGNEWFTSSGNIGVYVTHVMRASPSSITFAGVGQTQDVALTESYGGGKKTAMTGNAKIATARVLSVNKQLEQTIVSVTAVGPGSTNVTISDSRLNSLIVPVTVP